MNAQSPPKKSWLVEQPDVAATNELAIHVMNIMEQGIIVWSADGICEMHNTRVYEVLELTGDDLTIGTSRTDFLQHAEARGEFEADVREGASRKFRDDKPFSFDRRMPSGRIISTNARPSREGGYVVTFTDVTEARLMATKLEKAIEEAAKAEARTAEVLRLERARQSEGQLVAQLDEWLQSCKSLSELFEIVGAFMGRLLPKSQGELLVYSNSRDVLEGACSWGLPNPTPQISPDSCWALRRGRSYKFSSDALSFECEHVDQKGKSGPYICVPIIAHGDTVGLLHIKLPKNADAVGCSSPDDLATRCGEHISMAIANVKLRDELQAQSIRDPLTSLYNRRFFMDAMRREIGRAGAKAGTFGIISFDADHFKRFNDDHGHDAGDAVLQSLADVMLTNMPAQAMCCRVGGEEFVIILPDASAQETVEAADKLRISIAQMTVRHHHGGLPKVTISAGVSCFPEHGTSPQVLIKAADQALYKAKDAGRNTVILAAD